jgi:hypothetical protein
MKKLFLSEELDDSVEVVEVMPSDSEMICSNVINSLIKHE